MSESLDLIDALDLVPERQSRLARAARWGASTGLAEKLIRRAAPVADNLVGRLSGGRYLLTELATGLPTVQLTTTGARSGRDRTVPLAAVVDRGDLAVIGSNWGQPRHPAWVHNLAADPRARVSHAGRSVEVVAEQVNGERAEQIWRTARALYRGFRAYPERAGARQIRVFVLRPVALGADPESGVGPSAR